MKIAGFLAYAAAASAPLVSATPTKSGDVERRSATFDLNARSFNAIEARSPSPGGGNKGGANQGDANQGGANQGGANQGVNNNKDNGKGKAAAKKGGVKKVAAAGKTTLMEATTNSNGVLTFTPANKANKGKGGN